MKERPNHKREEPAVQEDSEHTLRPEEREELLLQLRKEMEAEHTERMAAFQARRRRARKAGTSHREAERERQVGALRHKVRDQFYKEMGYLKYTDSRGQEMWLPKEEHDWRMKARKRVGAKQFRTGTLEQKSVRVLVLYGSVIILALAVGIMLVRMRAG